MQSSKYCSLLALYFSRVQINFQNMLSDHHCRHICWLCGISVMLTEESMIFPLVSMYDISFVGSGGWKHFYSNFSPSFPCRGHSLEWYNKSFGHLCAVEVASIRNSFQPLIAEGPETNIWVMEDPAWHTLQPLGLTYVCAIDKQGLLGRVCSHLETP